MELQTDMEWQTAFNIHPDRLHELEEWCSKDPKRCQQSLLYWALEQKLLSIQDYLIWAKQKHQMPLIKENFFLEQDPNLKLLEHIKYGEKQLPWSMELLPLFHWKDCLFIACIEKPSEEWKLVFEKEGFHVQFVLGSIHGMKAWHQKLFSQAKVSPLTSTASTTNTTMSTSATMSTSTAMSTRASAIPKVSADEAKDGLYMAPEYSSSEVKKVFVELEKNFEGCMLLRFKENELCLVPWQWNSYCQHKRGEQKREKEKIDLRERSIFRIVHRSQQPYHGYVVMSSINQQFFDCWNEGGMPQHITICPILINRKTHADLVGMLLGFNNKHNVRDSEKCLLLVQKRAKNIAKSLDF